MTANDGAGIKVSVVIPVYNTRPYLAECLDSVLAQDMPSHEFEVVAVDDCSTFPFVTTPTSSCRSSCASTALARPATCDARHRWTPT